jgi:hypothetical protein
LRVYEECTAPLAAWYDHKGLRDVVSGDRAMDAVFADIVRIVTDRGCAG